MERNSASSSFYMVFCFLARRFTRARRPQVVAFLPFSLSFANGWCDGQGGSALLTELQHTFGKEVLLNRNLFKEYVLHTARILGWPLSSLPSGSVTVGVRPRYIEPVEATSLKALIQNLPLPAGVTQVLVDYLGEPWWSCKVCLEAPRALSPSAYTLKPITQCPRRILKLIFPFKCTIVNFSNGESLYAEWSMLEDILFFQATQIWGLVNLLRCVRRSLNYSAQVIHIGGLGDVFV